MRHFASKRDAIDFAIQELLDSLDDDLARMEGSDRDHYTDDDRMEMALKILDIREAEDDMKFSFKKG